VGLVTLAPPAIMRLFQKYFLGDVLRHTTVALSVTLLLIFVQNLFRHANSFQDVGASAALLGRVLQKSVDLLHFYWTFVCGFGLCSAMAHWSRQKHDQIIAGVGLRLGVVVWPGCVLSFALLLAGTGTLQGTQPSEGLQRVSWSSEGLWGAALLGTDAQWTWVEVRDEGRGGELVRGTADSFLDFPSGANVALAQEGWSANERSRLPYLILLALLMLRAMRVRAPKTAYFAYAAPIIGWFLWLGTSRMSSSFLGTGQWVEALAGGGAAAIVAATGFAAISALHSSKRKRGS
jgi:hypothetical protein